MGKGYWRRVRWSDLKVTLVDGSYHEVDSSEMAFKIAGSMAFKEGALKAAPILLETDHVLSRSLPLKSLWEGSSVTSIPEGERRQRWNIVWERA